jgi:hypothetical protein
VFQDLQWQWVSSETFLFGELEIKEIKNPDNFLDLYK